MDLINFMKKLIKKFFSPALVDALPVGGRRGSWCGAGPYNGSPSWYGPHGSPLAI